jgi:hypothetical protein
MPYDNGLFYQTSPYVPRFDSDTGVPFATWVKMPFGPTVFIHPDNFQMLQFWADGHGTKLIKYPDKGWITFTTEA